jgi:WS/DGAT/MGAT family acyltransferase
VLTGLERGRIAYYNRAHHACLDGMSGQAMLETIMDFSPEPRTVEPAPAGFFTERDQQSAAQLMAGAVENFARFQAKQPLAAFNGMGTAARLFQRTFDPRKGLGAISQRAPATRFNKAVETKRSYATGEISLDSVKTIAKLTHTKVNDVFLAACAGGLQRYLDRTGELPKTAMVAGCPVSMRRPGDTSPNNQVSMMLVSLATDESDPAERLQKIAQSSRTAKGLTQDVARSYDADVAMPGLPAAMTAGVSFADLTRMADRPSLTLASNVVVSNVPGPQQTLYSCGAKVLTHYPVSIPADTQAVNITVQSYAGTLYFALTACAKALPDADTLRDDIVAAYQEFKVLYDLPTIAVALQQRNVVSSAKSAENMQSHHTDDQPKAA